MDICQHAASGCNYPEGECLELCGHGARGIFVLRSVDLRGARLAPTTADENHSDDPRPTQLAEELRQAQAGEDLPWFLKPQAA